MTDTTWHEAGHAVFANIFKDNLFIQKITIIPNENDKGGNSIHSIKLDETTSDNFHLLIVHIAGLIIQYTNERRNDLTMVNSIIRYFEKRLNLNNNINDLFDGDFQNLQEPLQKLEVVLKLEDIKIICLAIAYITRCLMKWPIFWQAIDILVEELDKVKTMNNEQIESNFNGSGFNTFLKEFNYQLIALENELLYGN